MKKSFLVLAFLFFTSFSSLLSFDSLLSTSLTEQCPIDAAYQLIIPLTFIAAATMKFIGKKVPFTLFYTKNTRGRVDDNMQQKKPDLLDVVSKIRSIVLGSFAIEMATFFWGNKKLTLTFSSIAVAQSYINGSLYYEIERQKKLKRLS